MTCIRYTSKWHVEQSHLSIYLSTVMKVIINLISQETYICYNVKDKNNGKPNSIQSRVIQSVISHRKTDFEPQHQTLVKHLPNVNHSARDIQR